MGCLLREEPKDKEVGKTVIKKGYRIYRYMPISAVEFRLLTFLYKHSTKFVYSTLWQPYFKIRIQESVR
jgi:hypothetical protein